MLNRSDQPFHELPEFKRGRKAEDAILRYFWRRLGYIVLPLSRIEDAQGGGPKIYVPPNDRRSDLPRRLIAPDLECIRLTGWCNLPFDLPDELFIDAKDKGRATWYRTNQAWQSGIDRRVWNNYRMTEMGTKKPVWVFHLIGQATQEQMDKQRVPEAERPNPTGLYAHSVMLPIAPDPFDPNGTSKMVYWKIKDMVKIADLSDVMEDTDKGAS